MPQGFKISPKGLEELRAGSIEDPIMELALEILAQAGCPLMPENVNDVIIYFIDAFGSPEEAVEALRDGRASLQKTGMN